MNSMHTINIFHNNINCFCVYMQQEVIQKKSNSEITFFPRIIREFEDNDEPMYYGAKA
jgi:hypothetical protein